MKRVLAVALTVAFIGAGLPARADEPDNAHPPAQKTPAIPSQVPDAVTHHSVTVDGRAIAYTARAGTITLHNDKDQPTARMFYTAYTADGVTDLNRRPVTFAYNGGPGSSTIWLRMASFGPVRVVTADGTAGGPPPYRLLENQYSLLDKTDLVFIDAPGTGFSRLIGAGTPKEFFGVDQDVAAFSQFIQTYITKFDRWNSPKFLFGESYGTTRSAALVDVLQHQDVSFNGVLLLSSILSFGLDYSRSTIAAGDWAYVLYLPTEAATAWYHHRINRNVALDTFVEESRRFALGEYMNALAKGADLSASEKAGVVQRLHDFTGLSQSYIRESNLRVPYYRFQNELLRGQGKSVGRLDSRFETYNLDSAAEGPDWDPADVSLSAPFVSTFNHYVREDLKYDTDAHYYPTHYDFVSRAWDLKHAREEPPNVAPDLAEAMTTNPHLHVFSANGYYDFATPFFATDYTLRHLNLNPSLQKNITYGYYDSGHMVYIHEPALAKFKADVAHWYDMVLAR